MYFIQKKVNMRSKEIRKVKNINSQKQMRYLKIKTNLLINDSLFNLIREIDIKMKLSQISIDYLTSKLCNIIEIEMGNKCCRPQNNPDPKHNTLLRLIYHQTNRDFQQPLYDSILLILGKRGHVKTLIDHLSSHQQRIIPSLDYCRHKLRSVKNSRDYFDIVYVLTVTSHVCQKIVKLSVQIQQKLQIKLKQNKKVVNSAKSNKVDNINYILEQFEQIVYDICYQMLKLLMVNKLQIHQYSASLLEHTKHNYNQILSSVLSTILITSQRQALYVKINSEYIRKNLSALMNIITIKQKVYNKQSVSSPLKFRDDQSSLAIGSDSVKISQKQIKLQILQISHKNIQIGLQAYGNLIRKYQKTILNSNTYKDLSKEHLPQILSFWARQFPQNYSKISDIQKEQPKPESRQLTIIEQIILFYFNSYFSDNQSEYIYNELMIIFDRLKFSRKKIQPIEKLLFQALKNYDLREQVIYRWLDYLLDYIGVISDDNEFLEDIQSSYIYTMPKYTNHHSLTNQNIIGCILTVQAWIDNEIIDVKTVMTYKGTKIITVLLLNLKPHQQNVFRTLQNTFQKLISQYPQSYVMINQTIYKMLLKIKIPAENIFGYESTSQKLQDSKITQNIERIPKKSQKQYYNNEQTKYINDYIQCLINIGCKSSLLEMVPGDQFLKIFKKVTQNIFQKIHYSDQLKIKTFENIQNYIIAFWIMFSKFMFDNQIIFNMNNISLAFQNQVKYITSIMYQTRLIYKKLHDWKQKDDQESVVLQDLATAIFQLTINKQKTSKKSQNKSLQAIEGFMVERVYLFQKGFYLQLIKSIHSWYKNAEKGIKSSKKDYRFTKDNSAEQQIKSQIDIKQINDPQLKRVRSQVFDDPYACSKAYSGMAMCQYLIICETARELIYQISQSPQNTISVLHLLILIEACTKNRFEQTDSLIKNRKMNKRYISDRQRLRKQIQNFVKDVETSIQIIIEQNETRASKNNSRKNSLQYSKIQQSGIKEHTEIAYKLLENKNLIIEICDNIGPKQWKQNIQQIIDDDFTVPKHDFFCNPFKRIKKSSQKQPKNSKIRPINLSDLQDIQSHQKQIFLALHIQYQQYFQQRNDTIEINLIHKDTRQGQDSSKTDNLSINKMEISGNSSFHGVIEMLKQ